ncbi:pickpocket protein 28-like [Agrilus planipennis]|uniref:Pickpocket protein 28-like n=1 Tax=Agrilus planipennis TaxID=224129 RepID=A0A1W4XBD2_AGRPL|nr:pickpocket protein 28-like [Agrilus planipennis]
MMPTRRRNSKSKPIRNLPLNKYSTTVTHVWQSYCKKTSLHGLKYIGDHKLIIAERAFWTIAFASAVIFASYFVYQIYYRYDLNPIITSINPIPVSTNDIPFPAIKICNMNQAKRSVVEKINNKKYMNDTQSFFDYPKDVGEWDPETGYKDFSTPKYPYRASGAGSNHGLYVILDANLDDYYCSSTNSAGFKRYYSLNNCRLECESNYTSNHCGCIPFHLPILGEKDKDLCMLVQLECAREAAELMNEIETDTLQSRCRCLPNCYEIEYNINFSYGTLEHSFYYDGLFPGNVTKNEIAEYSRKNFATVSIFFGENHFDRYTKRLIYSFSDFLSSTGGLLGLFLGLSWLSIVEIIYYLIKLFVNLWRVRKELHQVQTHRNKIKLNSLLSGEQQRF